MAFLKKKLKKKKTQQELEKCLSQKGPHITLQTQVFKKSQVCL